MQILSLSSEQRSKLLEMTKALFPKYDMVHLTSGREWEKDSVAFRFNGEIIFIHWFQFCMTELLEKIYVPNPLKIVRGLKIRFEEFYWNTNLYWSGKKDNNIMHPVDYLYNQFLKLN